MNHFIKYARMRRNISMANYPQTAQAIIDSVPPALFDSLTSEQLVLVADALHSAYWCGRLSAEDEDT